MFLHHTHTHASWLNQIELSFSILQRRLLRYGGSESVDDVAERVITFINRHNRNAKPSAGPTTADHSKSRNHNDPRAAVLVAGWRAAAPLSN